MPKKVVVTMTVPDSSLPSASTAESEAILNDEGSDVSFDTLLEEATAFSVTVTEAEADPFADILDTLRDPHGAVVAVRQTFGLLALRHSIDVDVLEMRVGKKSRVDLHYQIGVMQPAATTGAATDHWRSLGGFFLGHRFENVELKDASWHPRRYPLEQINAIVEVWASKQMEPQPAELQPAEV